MISGSELVFFALMSTIQTISLCLANVIIARISSVKIDLIHFNQYDIGGYYVLMQMSGSF